jgi:hypothetical protein
VGVYSGVASDGQERTGRIYFSDVFNVSPAILEDYGAFNISLVNDLPLFVDPFHLFHSNDETYQQLHQGIIQYLRFLRDKSGSQNLDPDLIKAWYRFKEVKQNWLGFSRVGNRGSSLGADFAELLHARLGTIFRNFGEEQLTRGSHLEKVCLVAPGVGRDRISDFTTNLIKWYLLEYTEKFAKTYLHHQQRRMFTVQRVRFNYQTELWQSGRYELPHFAGDFVLLTPKNLLTRDDTWISRKDLLHNFEELAAALPNDEIRAQLNHYFWSQLSKDPELSSEDREKNKMEAIERTINEYPQIIEYYIRDKEDDGDRATALSGEEVWETQRLFVEQVRAFVTDVLAETEFYKLDSDSHEGALARVHLLKRAIEEQDGYRFLYFEGEPIKRESDLQLLYLLAWRAVPTSGSSSTDRRKNDSTSLEFKLASNPQLRRYLERRADSAGQSADAVQKLTIVCCFSREELAKIRGLLTELGLAEDSSTVLIDARWNEQLHALESPSTASAGQTNLARSASAPVVDNSSAQERHDPYLIADLKEAIAKGQIVAVLGAGVAIHSSGNARVASWVGLLRDGIERCVHLGRGNDVWAARRHAELESGDIGNLLGVAEQVAVKLGAPNGGDFAGWLRDTVGALELQQGDVLTALQRLELTVATTNYDDLAERALELRPVTWLDPARMQRVLRRDEFGILHLHGHWERPESVVLGTQSYEAVVSSTPAQAILRGLPVMKSLLFVGFGAGLNDPNFGAFLRWTRAAFATSQYRHYRLARSSEVEDLQKTHPNEERISVLPYGDNYNDLAPFLEDLAS